MWSPGGQLPYEYIKIEKKNTCMWHVNYSRSPPPPDCSAESALKPGQCRGQSASLALPSFGYRQGF